LSTVESYIAEAIAAGFAYSWERLGISDRVLEIVAASAVEALASPATWIARHAAGTKALERASASHAQPASTVTGDARLASISQESHCQATVRHPPESPLMSKPPEMSLSGQSATFSRGHNSSVAFSGTEQQQLSPRSEQQLLPKQSDQSDKVLRPSPLIAAAVSSAGVLASDSDEELTPSQFSQLDNILQPVAVPSTAISGSDAHPGSLHYRRYTSARAELSSRDAHVQQNARLLLNGTPLAGIFSAAALHCKGSSETARDSIQTGTATVSGNSVKLGCEEHERPSSTCNSEGAPTPNASVCGKRLLPDSLPLQGMISATRVPLVESIAAIASINSTMLPATREACNLRDLSTQLSKNGVSVKMLKEALPQEISFGHLRLAMAHVGRLAVTDCPD
jgi:hypothetical protein